jgi:hypothetical protein
MAEFKNISASVNSNLNGATASYTFYIVPAIPIDAGGILLV